MNRFETENFKDIKQKEKMLLYVIVLILSGVYYILGMLGNIQENKETIAYNNENIKIYENALLNKNAIANNIKKEDIVLDNIIQDSNSYIKSLKDKTLKFTDLNNYKYIEYFINYHLTEVGQANIKLGGDGTKYVNFNEQGIKLTVVTNNEEDISYLLEEFNNAGYLGGFEISKTGNLFECNIQLVFMVN